MGRSRDIAKFLSATEAENTDNLYLLHTGSNVGVDSARAQRIGLQTYSTLDSLPMTDLEQGEQAFITGTNRLYISNGAGWYNVALVNQSPQWDSGGEPDTSYTIADSATPLVITARAIDSDNSNINLFNQSFVTDSAQYMVDISNDSSVFTFTPKSADSIGIEVGSGNLSDSNGDFIYTFKWSDGINFVSKAVTISYTPSGWAGYDFSSHTFTSAGATGRDGPTQSQLDTAYGSASWYTAAADFSSDNGIQIWRVPETATYRIVADGAYGGVDTEPGRPARIQGDIDLTLGEYIYILVGQAGNRVDDGGAAGGGGGTFIVRGTDVDDVMIVAGGGGGADGGPNGGNASTTTVANADGDGISSGSGSGGNGAVSGGASGGGGGAGLVGNGSDGNGGGGASYMNGGRGGAAGTGAAAHEGGFGGGGGSAGASSGGGGGGGFTGGKGGDGNGADPDTAGGSSFTSSDVTNVTKSLLAAIADPGTGNNDGAPISGKVVITKL